MMFAAGASAAAPETPDAEFANVKLLANNAAASTMVDYSPVGRTLTANLGATGDSTVTKFPGQRVMSFATNSSITVPYNTDLNMGVTGSVWTVEAWVYLNAAQSGITAQRLSVFGSNGGNGLQCTISATGMAVFYPTGAVVRGQTVSLASGTWHHLVWMRNGATHRLGANGTIYAPVTDGSVNATSNNTRIGSNGANNTGITYRLYDVRVTTAVNRYNMTSGGSYTVPTSRFPRS